MLNVTKAFAVNVITFTSVRAVKNSFVLIAVLLSSVGNVMVDFVNHSSFNVMVVS